MGFPRDSDAHVVVVIVIVVVDIETGGAKATNNDQALPISIRSTRARTAFKYITASNP